MENISSRGPARFVGYLDLILSFGVLRTTSALFLLFSYCALHNMKQKRVVHRMNENNPIGILILTIIGAIASIIVITNDILQMNLDFERDFNFIVFLVIIGVVIGLLNLLSIFFSILLLKATKLNADPKTSLGLVNIWLAMNIFVFVLCIICGINQLFRGKWISLVVLLCVRGPFIWLVQRYKNDLTCHCVHQPSPPLPTSSV